MSGDLAKLPWQHERSCRSAVSASQPDTRGCLRQHEAVHPQPPNPDLSGAGESKAAAVCGRHYPESKQSDTYACIYMSVECCGFESHPRQLIFLRKSDCLGCAVLLCLLASFFLPSHLSLKTCVCVCDRE